MVIDASAIIAILRREPEREKFLAALLRSSVRLLSAITALEASMVLDGQYGSEAGADLDLFLYASKIEIVPLDRVQFEVARLAWQRYGKGKHRARLNLGDCCVYALAKVSGAPVLCKGRDFPQTDIEVVTLD